MSSMGSGGYQAGGQAQVASEHGGGGPQMPPSRNDKMVALVGLALLAAAVGAIILL